MLIKQKRRAHGVEELDGLIFVNGQETLLTCRHGLYIWHESLLALQEKRTTRTRATEPAFLSEASIV